MSTASDQYKKWLTAGQTNAALIDTIEVRHSSFVSSFFLANWDVTIECNLEAAAGGGLRTFTGTRFRLEYASTEDSLDQGVQIGISSLDGLLYDEFKSMTPVQRREPVEIVARQYLSTDLSTVVMTPPPVWYLTNITADFDTIVGVLQAIQLRSRRVGRYYTNRELPILEYMY